MERPILAMLAAGPMSAPEIAARLRKAGHDVTDLDVRAALRPLFGSRVTHDGSAWRLLDTTTASTFAALTASGAAVVGGLRAQHRAGGAL